MKLAGRPVLVVGGGAMATVRARQLAEVGARVKLVAPEVREEAAALAAEVHRRPFRPSDVDGVWFAVAAAPPEVNRQVAEAAEARRVLLNAVDDPSHASAYTGGAIRRGAAVIAISTGGRAPALAGLLREGIESCLPEDLEEWVGVAERLRADWKRAGVPLPERRRLLLERLNARYSARREDERVPDPLP